MIWFELGYCCCCCKKDSLIIVLLCAVVSFLSLLICRAIFNAIIKDIYFAKEELAVQHEQIICSYLLCFTLWNCRILFTEETDIGVCFCGLWVFNQSLLFCLRCCMWPYLPQHNINVNIAEVLKLEPDKLPNTTTVTKGGKTGNLFAQSVCREQMTRKIKSANKVETST